MAHIVIHLLNHRIDRASSSTGTPCPVMTQAIFHNRIMTSWRHSLRLLSCPVFHLNLHMISIFIDLLIVLTSRKHMSVSSTMTNSTRPWWGGIIALGGDQIAHNNSRTSMHTLNPTVVHRLVRRRSFKISHAEFVCLLHGLESASGAVKGGRIIHNMPAGLDNLGLIDSVYVNGVPLLGKWNEPKSHKSG